MPNYRKTKIACYMGFITQAIAANFAPLLFLKFHNDYQIALGKIALISTCFFLTQLLVDLLYSAAPPYEVLCTKWLSYGDVLELKDIEEMTEVHYNSRQIGRAHV